MSDDFELKKIEFKEYVPPPPGESLVVRDDCSPEVHRGAPPKPTLRDFICMKCQTYPRQMYCYSAESGRSCGASSVQGPGVFDCGDGYIAGECQCHGETCQFIATYAQVWLARDAKEKIPVFFSDALEDAGKKIPLAPKQIKGREVGGPGAAEN